MLGRRFILGLSSLVVALCSGCASSDYSQISATSLNVPDTTLFIQSNDFRVAPLDLLEVKVFGVEDLSGDYQVDPDGKIKFPLVGVVEVKGLTVFELAAMLESRLAESYLQNPQVSIRTKEAFGQQVTVEGAVVKPGMYPLRGKLSLMQAVALSGGPTTSANPARVVIFRTVEGSRHAALFDLTKIRSGQAEDPAVYGNDIVVMDGSMLKSGWDEFVRAIPILGLFVATGG